MSEPNDHLSMKLQRANRVPLATREIAESMAHMLIRHVYGEDEYHLQLPLHVTEADDRWVIDGSGDYDGLEAKPGRLTSGPISLEIMKDNCRVIKLNLKAAW